MLMIHYYTFCRCSHDARNKLGARLTTVKSKGPIKGLLKKMGNKLSCSCGPLKIKGYRFDPGSEPWDAQADILRRGKNAGPILKYGLFVNSLYFILIKSRIVLTRLDLSILIIF